jgi:hypothetical protein
MNYMYFLLEPGKNVPLRVKFNESNEYFPHNMFKILMF